MPNEVESAGHIQSPGAPEQLRRLGKYELIAMIGEGGMAEVHLARQRGPMNFEKIVVVKTIHQHLARKQKFIKMLLDEARIAALLKHPCVVDIYDLGFEDNTHFIAMEHLAGEPLLGVLRAGIKQKALDIPSTARLIADVADGLHAAHDLVDPSGKPMQLVHRDITPGNIVVLYTGQVKIVDFGIAKARGRLSDETDADHFKGKLGYISPEQVNGEPIDRRADIFSLGVVMWEALALRRLFRKDNPAAAAEAILRKNIPPPSKFRSSVPPRLDSICLKALARDLDERYATAEELHNDIERFLSAGSFRPHKATIRKYMQEVFADNKKKREDLLKRAVETTTAIQLALPERGEDPSVSGREDDLPGGPMFTGPQPLVDPALLEERTPSGHGQVARSNTYLPAAGFAPAVSYRDKKLWIGLGAGGLFLLIIIAMAASGGEDTVDEGQSAAASLAANDAPRTPPETPPDVPPDTPPVENVQTPDAGVPPIDAAPVIEMAPDPVRPPGDKKKPDIKKKPRGNAKSLYNQGLKLYVDGKHARARSKFKQALAVKPSYAQAYRGLGMVYMKQKNKRRAISSFKKYLKLAPRAKDRKSIQKRIKSLGG